MPGIILFIYLYHHTVQVARVQVQYLRQWLDEKEHHFLHLLPSSLPFRPCLLFFIYYKGPKIIKELLQFFNQTMRLLILHSQSSIYVCKNDVLLASYYLHNQKTGYTNMMDLYIVNWPMHCHSLCKLVKTLCHPLTGLARM